MIKIFQLLLFTCCTTTLLAQYKTTIYVAQDGSGDFTSIQAAIDATKSFPDHPITIHIQAGVYNEKVKVYVWNTNLTLRGADSATTIIRYADYFKKMERGRNSTFHTPTLLVQGDNFRAENLTIENNAGRVGQAVALAVEADRALFINCRVLGNQDTLYAAGANTRQYYSGCYIEGTTDFIFGAATALFEGCQIFSKSNSFITAASTPQGREFGFVFLNCDIRAAAGVDSVYLGRPWRDYAKTVFINCNLGTHILPVGWNNWSSPTREETVFYGEYNNHGEGANPKQRAKWSQQLSRREAKKYNLKNILKPFSLPPMELDDLDR